MDDVIVRRFETDDLESVVALSLRAWRPFFEQFASHFGDKLDRALHPDWRSEQTKVVTAGCTNADHHVAVAVVDDGVAGFGVVKLDREESIGELYLLAVDPAHQGRGIGGQLNEWALDVMRANGMRVANVGTGGDPSHAAARRSYEKAGYTALPIVQYFQVLSE